ELPSFVIEVVSGADQGKRLEVDAALEATRVHVGTSQACALVLTDPLVSRRHFALQPEAGQVRLLDTGSTNGTGVAGARCIEAILEGGETIKVGDTTLRFTARGGDRVQTRAASGFGRVVGASPEMRKLYPLLARLAHSEVPVILEGETGTGKELV